MDIRQRVLVATKLHAALRMHFAHWSAATIGLAAAYERFVDEALAAPDRRAFSFAAMRFVASFGNGHTAFGDDWLWREYGAPTGLSVRRLADSRWSVVASAHSAIPPGVAVEAVDGEPIGDFFSRCRPFIAASSEREAAFRLFARPFLLPKRFVLTLDPGREVAVERGAASLSLDGRPRMRWLQGDTVALLTLPSFAAPEFEEQAVAFVRSLDPKTGLIIDVRGNGGGDTPEQLVAALMPQRYRYWRWTTPVHDAFHLAKGTSPATRTEEAEWHEPTTGVFPRPLAILIDGGSFSAAEDFVAPFKDNGRAVLVGEATGGSSGQPYVEDLGDGMRVWVSAKRQYLPDGSEFEGVGIAPDIVIPRDADDIASGRDPMLDRALEIVASDIGLARVFLTL